MIKKDEVSSDLDEMLGFLLGVGWIQGDVDGAQTQAGDVQRDGVHILRDSCENSVTFLNF